ncbi:MAG: bifunctional diaminohydroxyphosphoribosylaminopyrimidine deaminase/5-amino-6-(5-phosphoribosylamino)uracil reductase RibD [Bacteroidia bacterium]
MHSEDLLYLHRSLHLAKLGSSAVFPNPQVGAVVVHQGRIIGEGYHAYAGGPHAEVVALGAVQHPAWLPDATIYVSLEPCSYHGKTPPCADLIVRHRLARVVVGCQDPNPRVSGSGIARMRAAGIEVVLAPDPRPFEALNRAFFINQQEQRPRITLKWAETCDGFVARLDASGQPLPLPITGPQAQAFTHKLRAAHHVIATGRRTVAADNPRLDTRHYYGASPQRLIFDPDLRLPTDLHAFAPTAPVWILSRHRHETQGHLHYIVPSQWDDLDLLTRELYTRYGLCSLFIEGGPTLLQGFLDQGVYDEVHILQAPTSLGQGLPAPRRPAHLRIEAAGYLGPDLHLHGVRQPRA